MKRKLFWSIGIVIILILLYSGYAIWFDRNYKFRLTENESKILLDSLRINDTLNLYLFKYETYVGNSPTNFISIEHNACQCNQKNALVKGEFISGIKEIKNDSIFIVSLYGFKLIKPNNNFYFIDVQDTTNNMNYIRHIPKEILFRNLCK